MIEAFFLDIDDEERVRRSVRESFVGLSRRTPLCYTTASHASLNCASSLLRPGAETPAINLALHE